MDQNYRDRAPDEAGQRPPFPPMANQATPSPYAGPLGMQQFYAPAAACSKPATPLVAILGIVAALVVAVVIAVASVADGDDGRASQPPESTTTAISSTKGEIVDRRYEESNGYFSVQFPYSKEPDYVREEWHPEAPYEVGESWATSTFKASFSINREQLFREDLALTSYDQALARLREVADLMAENWGTTLYSIEEKQIDGALAALHFELFSEGDPETEYEEQRGDVFLVVDAMIDRSALYYVIVGAENLREARLNRAFIESFKLGKGSTTNSANEVPLEAAPPEASPVD